jgi:hypothetical protein
LEWLNEASSDCADRAKVMPMPSEPAYPPKHDTTFHHCSGTKQ